MFAASVSAVSGLVPPNAGSDAVRTPCGAGPTIVPT